MVNFPDSIWPGLAASRERAALFIQSLFGAVLGIPELPSSHICRGPRRGSEQPLRLGTRLRAKPRVRKLCFQTPLPQIVCIESDAEEISGKKSEFRRSHSDETDNNAVCSGNDPALPQLLPAKDRR